jgi:hypothetical protein
MNPTWRKNYLRYRSYFLNVSTQYKERADLKVYLEIFLSLITVILFAIFALRPTLVTIAELITEIETKKETLAVMDAKLQNINAAYSIHDQNITSIRLIKDAIPESSSPDVFTRHIEGLVIKNNTILSNLSMDPNIIYGEGEIKGTSTNTQTEALPQDSDALSFTVVLKGPLTAYQSLHGFLSDMEKLRRPVKIDSINLSTAIEQQTRETILLFTINGRTPFFKDKEAVE